MAQGYIPDPMTPAWSRDLAEVGSSPFWRGDAGMKQRAVFIEQASQYATYEDMPANLKATYQKASRARQSGRSEQSGRSGRSQRTSRQHH